MNVYDHEAVAAFLDNLGVSLEAHRFTARYNLSPTDPVHAVFAADAAQVAQMRWGLVPRNPRQRGVLINARAESAWQKPAFREAMRRRRAVVPVNGFYEWRREGGARVPFHVTGDTPVLALAGLYEIDREGEMCCCVLTTRANAQMREVHDRMPVILAPHTARDWLFCNERDRLDALLESAQGQSLQLQRVSTFVNNSRNDGPQCMASMAH